MSSHETPPTQDRDAAASGPRQPASLGGSALRPASTAIPAESLAGALRSLPSGSATERQAGVIGWSLSAAVHAAAAVVAFLVTWTVVQFVETPRDPVVADFTAPAYQPLASLADAAAEAPPSEAAPSGAALAERIEAALAATAGGPLELIAGTGRSAEVPLPAAAGERSDQTVSFAGLRATNARSVVFVVDASGSMIGAFRTVVDELARSLSALVPSQSYAVIFFQRNAALAVPPANRLVPVSRRAIDETMQWIRSSVVPSGRSNPLEALQRALSLRPDCVFLLSCNITGTGQFEIDQRTLLDTLDRLNPIERSTGRRRSVIQSIQFLDEDPLETMRIIADRHGGGGRAFKFLSRAELGLAPAGEADAAGDEAREESRPGRSSP